VAGATREALERLTGRVALITAAGSGMGLASARRLAREGAHVIAVDIDDARAGAAVEAIEAEGGSAEAAQCDVGDERAVARLLTEVRREHDVLHILFNHAGIPGPAGLEVEVADWDRTVDVNLKSAWFVSSYALPLLRNAGTKASIIFTASTSGIVGSPSAPLYSMTKGGVVLLMKSLAVTLGPEGIRANAICPAMIDTPMLPQFFGREAGADIEDFKSKFMSAVPLSRTATAEEVAGVVAFLASDDASWVTGVALPVDGGFLAK